MIAPEPTQSGGDEADGSAPARQRGRHPPPDRGPVRARREGRASLPYGLYDPDSCGQAGASAPAGMAVEIHFELQASGSAARLFTPCMVRIKGWESTRGMP
jgi:hypothetical protein